MVDLWKLLEVLIEIQEEQFYGFEKWVMQLKERSENK
jgi:hypothetical protein